MESIYSALKGAWMDGLTVFFSRLGEYGLLWAVIGVVLIALKKYRKYGFMLLAAAFISFAIGEFAIKNVVCGTRPFYEVSNIDVPIKISESFSFPSSHATLAFSSSSILYKMNRTVGIIAILVSILIAFSRIYFFAHYPTDILAGAVIGIICAEAVYFYGERRLGVTRAKADL